MFSSPSVRLFTSENADNMIQKKPGTNQLCRKPFVDRSVNSNTPDITNKPLKHKLTFAKEICTVERSKTLEDKLNSEDFIYSFKDVEDTYSDVYSQPCLSKKGVLKILHSYCNREDTPPPPSPEPVKLEIDPMFFELPELERPKFGEDLFVNNTYNVELPELD